MTKNQSQISQNNTTLNITSIHLDDSISLMNTHFLNNLNEKKVSRKISDDVIAKNSLKHYKNINNFRDMIFKTEKIRKHSANDCTKHKQLEVIDEVTVEMEDKKINSENT